MPSPSRGILSALSLAFTGLLWAAGMLWSARVSITGQTDAEIEVTSTAYAMPGTISAMLVAGAAVGLVVLALVSRRGREPGTTVRFVISTGSGVIIGGLGALAIITINTDGWIYAVAGGTIAAAATIGGALAGLPRPRITAAVSWAAIAVFLVGMVLAFLQDDLLPVFGAGSSSASQANAANYWGYAQGILGGLAAGLITYRLLRKDTDLRWPLFGLAGAGPGLLLVLGEILVRTAGARVFDLAGRVSVLDSTIQTMLSGTRLNNALMVLFVGAFTAIVAFGRTLSSPADVEPAPKPSRRAAPVTAAASSTTDADQIEEAARAE
jgi:iron complex transport system permease protein